MEPNNSINHIDDDGDQNSFPIDSTQVITPIDSTQLNPLSESSVLGLVLLAHTFSYDIQYLTESLLLEILARLPLKSIFRFKCVCKHWLDLISQPSFARFYCSCMLTASTSSSSLPFRILYRYIYVSKFTDVLDRFRPETYNSSKFSVLCSLKKKQNVRSGSLRNIDSARISIPGTVKYDDSQQWYEGLSEKFLSSPVPKLLLLAGTDRLDRALTIGQMQGKFQMVVFRHTGHAIQSLFGSLDKLVAPDRPCPTLGHEYGHIMEHFRAVVGLPLGDPSMKWPTCIM
ncbi:unnamed protein product [Lactuca virosa]|uniref:F-box domain-containing protein n=1 Tax=Lactuca virosa TaxID=75947 RepID=A0AAU9N7H1_9ASTR|nr:unnamed protein product [Lactuca virosa]